MPCSELVSETEVETVEVADGIAAEIMIPHTVVQLQYYLVDRPIIHAKFGLAESILGTIWRSTTARATASPRGA
jgi:hypothetical protein